MSKLVKLSCVEESVLWHGNVLRTPGGFPYEKYVDFMVFETGEQDFPFGLIITSGYKAGLILTHLPKEGCAAGGGLSKEWVIINWRKWVYAESDPLDVYYLERYMAGL